MTTNEDGLKSIRSISEILCENFYIPSYQRGYKWEEIQVVELLEDILEFSNKKHKEENEFYCIQPLVVKEDEEKKHYRVLDGQQRLTTIYLILKYLKDINVYSGKIYSLEYETRKGSKEFLENISPKINNSNSDYWFISRAYIAIKKWFENKKNIKTEDIKTFKKTLLENVKFIWYDIDIADKEIDTFTRLNMGKIPLTNAELIKGLFILNSDNKILLSTQWDAIESKLQDDEFFYFLFGKVEDTSTRIGYIFDLIADKSNLTQYKDQERKSYYVFNKLLNADPSEIEHESENKNKKKTKSDIVEELWATVKNYFRIFTELYENTEYYHLVGYLTNRKSPKDKKDIKDIIQLFNDKTNDEFLDELKLQSKINLPEQLEDLSYDKNEDTNNIHDVLFLFNILTSIKMVNYKYSFYSHINEKWELEHIHPRNPENVSEEQQKEIKYEDDNSISNLALLAKGLNGSVSNYLFDVKRTKVQNAYEHAKYIIPPCTLNVFSSYYNKNRISIVYNNIWGKNDRYFYLIAIKNTLTNYLT